MIREFSRKPRVLLYVKNGLGLGHLRRTCRIAGALRSFCTCVVVSYHREAAWMLPPDIHLVLLPSLKAYELLEAGLVPEMATDQRRPSARRSMLQALVHDFAPDAIFVDQAPLGSREELREILQTSNAKKYFVFRGIQTRQAISQKSLCDALRMAALTEHYHRIFATIDLRVANIIDDYALPDAVASKVTNVGYVSQPIGTNAIRQVRRERQASPGPWVVCSAGGGALGERLMLTALELAKQHENWKFDIVTGPRSGVKFPLSGVNVAEDGNLRLWRVNDAVPLLHAAADVVICSGGYNSLVECLEGNARIVAVPVQQPPDDEQSLHCERLNYLYPVELVTELGDLDRIASSKVVEARSGALPSARKLVNLNGANAICKIVADDMNHLWAAPSATHQGVAARSSGQ